MGSTLVRQMQSRNTCSVPRARREKVESLAREYESRYRGLIAATPKGERMLRSTTRGATVIAFGRRANVFVGSYSGSPGLGVSGRNKWVARKSCKGELKKPYSDAAAGFAAKYDHRMPQLECSAQIRLCHPVDESVSASRVRLAPSLGWPPNWFQFALDPFAHDHNPANPCLLCG